LIGSPLLAKPLLVAASGSARAHSEKKNEAQFLLRATNGSRTRASAMLQCSNARCDNPYCDILVDT
jgi:hypothetical protein